MTWVVAGLIIGVVVYLLDYVMWGKVFTKGMDQYVTPPAAGQPLQMAPQLTKSLVLAFVFSIAFAGLYEHFRASLWATGILGGMEFGTILWLPTIALSTIGSGVWFDKVRPLLWGQFWSWLVRVNIAGVVAAVLIK